MSKAENWSRCYGSEERVRWLAAKPCIVCSRTPCDNAHIRSGGVGRKADYEFTVPMCGNHHQEYHTQGHLTFEKKYGVTLVVLAAMYEGAWKRECQKRPAERSAPTDTILPTE